MADVKDLAGKEVTALTYPSDEYERGPEKVSGLLDVRYVSTLQYFQFLVAGIPVDSATIEIIS